MMATKKNEPPALVKEPPIISSITLGGFQVFDESTTIPLGRLTFLFGPNSAGKSAVEDAILLLKDILKNGYSPRSRQVPGEWSEFAFLDQHWRRVSDRKSGRSEWLHVGITTHLPTDIRGVLYSDDRFSKSSGTPYTSGVCQNIGLTYRYEYDDTAMQTETETTDTTEWRVFCDPEVSIDEIPVLRLEELYSGASINLEHPILDGWQMRKKLAALSILPEDVMQLSGGWLRFDSNGLIPSIDTKEGKLVRSRFYDGWTRENRFITDNVRAIFEDFADCFDTLYGTILGNLHLAVDIVPASRTVPTVGDLTHVIRLDGSNFFRPQLEWGLSSTGASQYKRVAEAALRGRWKFDAVWGGQPKSSLFDSVNLALSGHLFIERGYRLDSEYKIVLDRTTAEKLATEGDFNPHDCAFIVNLHLVDSQSRAFSFDAVGSGLGYVLPIVCSVCDPYHTVSLLQQPELHLHPALQAAMGDLLIDALNQHDEKQIIVETHSEHVLLRVLKRIRQTSQRIQHSPELAIYPEDVSVVYFNSTPDGTSTVKHLRVSPDGDFLDMWPRGFFAERDQDLFDE